MGREFTRKKTRSDNTVEKIAPRPTGRNEHFQKILINDFSHNDMSNSNQVDSPMPNLRGYFNVDNLNGIGSNTGQQYQIMGDSLAVKDEAWLWDVKSDLCHVLGRFFGLSHRF